jgi:hypothetical protein
LVAYVYSQDELAVLTSRLSWENIWCFAHSARHIAIDVGLTWALGGIRLFVHREAAKAARALLAETPAWERVGGVYDRWPVLDWVMALFLVLATGVAPPARIQSSLVQARQERNFSRG